MRSKDDIIAAILGCRDADAVYGLHIEKLVTVFRWLPRERERVASEETADMQAVHDDIVLFISDAEAKLG